MSADFSVSDLAARAFEIVFVCTGNHCRSPMAETVLRAMVAERRSTSRFRITSAALRPHHIGRPADPRAVAATRRRGYEWTARPGRLLGAATRADLFIGMGPWHSQRLAETLSARDASRIRSLPDYGATGVREVPDPYHGNASDFEHALDLIESSCAALLGALHPIGEPLHFGATA
jgi:protein-tyrosine phosphatase